MKQGIDALIGIKYKLRLMGISLQVYHIFMGTIYQLYIIYQD